MSEVTKVKAIAGRHQHFHCGRAGLPHDHVPGRCAARKRRRPCRQPSVAQHPPADRLVALAARSGLQNPCAVIS